MTELMHESKRPVTIVSPVEVGIGESQVLVVTEIPLRPSARRILEIFREVEVTNCKAVKNKVIINGELRKTILYLTGGSGSGGGSGRPPGNAVGSGHAGGHCHVNTCDVKAACVTAPFAMFIEVPGSQEGDMCIIEKAKVEGSKEEELQVASDGAFGALLEKTVILVQAKVARQKQIPVRPEWP
ncbi:MAG TPA: DUF3794 domain-containing protein [Clostridia bacterium]|nr:DUF3794 domain-containing protein [Clostridia bacterium]